jgi:hypothetical protein
MTRPRGVLGCGTGLRFSCLDLGLAGTEWLLAIFAALPPSMHGEALERKSRPKRTGSDLVIDNSAGPFKN